LLQALEVQAKAFGAKGMHQEAMHLLEQAVQQSDSRGDAVRVAELRFALAGIQITSKHYDEAKRSLNAAMADAHALGLTSLAARCLDMQALIAEQQNDFASAYYTMRQLVDVEQQVNEQQSLRKIAGAQLELKFAQKEQEAINALTREAATAQTNMQLQVLNAALLAADQEKSSLIAQLERLSRTDALSGLANRRALFEQFEKALGNSTRHSEPMAVALLDIDHFKKINDNYSHAIGDAVIKQLGAILTEQCRETDFAARYGGEEFACIFERCGLVDALNACERIRAAVEQFNWATIEPTLKVTTSIGMAEAMNKLADAKAALNAADEALYRAKRGGRNRVEQYAEGLAAD
jgi:diguanylate cyclase (GGDEF)-like protein